MKNKKSSIKDFQSSQPSVSKAKNTKEKFKNLALKVGRAKLVIKSLENAAQDTRLSNDLAGLELYKVEQPSAPAQTNNANNNTNATTSENSPSQMQI